MTWPDIDENHRHCLDCSAVCRRIELTKGLCKACVVSVNEEASTKLEAAESRITGEATKAATQLLAAMQSQGRTGASMPRVMSKFLEGLGGEDGLGELLTQEFKKAHGVGLTPAEAETWGETSPKLRMQWHELVMRSLSKTDEGRVLDVASLEEADLESILVGVGHRAIMEDPGMRRAVLWAAIRDDREFRKLAFYEIARQDKDLVDEFMRNGGIITFESEKLQPSNNKVEEEENYDPSEDEYKD